VYIHRRQRHSWRLVHVTEASGRGGEFPQMRDNAVCIALASKTGLRKHKESGKLPRTVA